MDDVRRALEVLQRAVGATVTTLTVVEIWRKYAEWAPKHKKSWEGLSTHWRLHLEPFWGSRQVGGLTLEDADAYRELRSKEKTHLGRLTASTTRNHELSTLRACFNWALRRRLIGFNPLAGMEMEPQSGGRRYWLTESSFQALLGNARPILFAKILAVGYDTGMREGELLNLEWTQINLEAKVVILGDGDTKNGSGRLVPLTDRALAAINECPRWSRWVFSRESGQPIPKSTLTDWFRAARGRAGLPTECVFHSLPSLRRDLLFFSAA